MKRRVWIGCILLTVNIPWMVLWWYYSRPCMTQAACVPILFLLLVFAVLCAVLLPIFLLGNLLPRRWLLIMLLGFVNLFWGLQWLDRFNHALPDAVAYQRARFFFLGMMGLSSLFVWGVYRGIGWCLTRFRQH